MNLSSLFSWLMALLLTSQVQAQDPVFQDIIYASPDGLDLDLDIYLPETDSAAPLVIYLHGGIWRLGDKSGERNYGYIRPFLENGYAVASLNFRASTDAPFPAMVHDIKAAIRYLRANAADLRFNASGIAVIGSSSGAHLAQVVGTSNGHPQLEGSLGNHLNTSSDVQAIISYFGASDLTTILEQSTPFGLIIREPALELLLGTQPDDNDYLAQLASPVVHVDENDPPLLLFHGDMDPQMPVNQSLQMFGAYKAADLHVIFEPVHGAMHGGPEFFEEQHLSTAIDFLGHTIGR